MPFQKEASYAVQSGRRVRMVVLAGDVRFEVLLDPAEALDLAQQLKMAATGSVTHAQAMQQAHGF